MVNKIIRIIRKLIRSIWLFPAIITLIFALLVVFRINNSSIGIYQSFFNGNQPDKNLIIGRPRAIRSDEWLVNTQEIIAQNRAGYPLVNKNIGQGQNMSVVADVPYKEWSLIFKPHEWAFFVLPFDMAFAFRRWAMGCLLLLAGYFFTLKLLPGRRLVASLIALTLFFSPFVQWWYTHGTLGSLYYSLFIGIVVMNLFTVERRGVKMLLTALLAYLIVCFALVQYPPFQIACGVVLFIFCLGYVLSLLPAHPLKRLIKVLGAIFCALIVGAALIWLFLITRADVVSIINHTAYPGQRSLASGGFSWRHFFSSHLSFQFLFTNKADQYLIDGVGHTNQSEASNFLLIAPFLFLPLLALAVRQYWSDRKLNWMALSVLLIFVILLAELFYPSFTYLSSFLFFNKVGAARSLIGMGLLNAFMIIVFIKTQSQVKETWLWPWISVYVSLIFAFSLYLGYWALSHDGSFINWPMVLLLSVPLPVVVLLLLSGQYEWALVLYFLFSFVSSAPVNPLYRGLGAIMSNPVTNTIHELSNNSAKTWITPGSYLNNIAAVADAPSLTNVYTYPQLSLWQGIGGAKIEDYNRYAHVDFRLTDDKTKATTLKLVTPDSFEINTYVCSSFLRDKSVGFVLSYDKLNAPCLTQVRTVESPSLTINIYQTTFSP